MLARKKTYNKNNIRDITKVFNDGVCFVYSANERELGEYKGKLNFAYESVGIGHFYQAYNNNISIDNSISVILNKISIDPQDIVRIGDEWYRVVRIQYHDIKRPFYYTLSLQRSPFTFEVQDEN